MSNFWDVNKRIVRKPFLILKISSVFQELEGFTFATALDLNMGYYTIRSWIKMHPKCAPSYFLEESIPTKDDQQWALQVFQTFFQGKMLELMESLEYVRAYLDYLLCISKLSLEDHLEKLEEVLSQLWDAGLKVNAEN